MTPQVNVHRAIGGLMRLDVDGQPTGIGVQGRVTRVDFGDWLAYPSEIEAYVRGVNTYIETLNEDYHQVGVPVNLTEGWDRFFAEWKAWYGDGPNFWGISGPSTFWRADDVAKQYKVRAEAFRATLQQSTSVALATPETAIPPVLEAGTGLEQAVTDIAKGAKTGAVDLGTYVKWGVIALVSVYALSIALPAIRSLAASKK